MRHVSRKHRFGLLSLGLALIGAGVLATSTRAQVGEGEGVGPVDPQPLCVLVPNGNFKIVGTTGVPAAWKTLADGGGFGDFGFGSSVGVVDVGSPNGNVVELSASSGASFENSWPAGSAGSGRALIQSDDFSLFGDKLIFQVVDGGFGGSFFDGGRVGYNFAVLVENLTAGGEYQESVAGGFFAGDPPLGCDLGLAFTGIFLPETVCLDLGAEGFESGDVVRVSFILQTNAAALTECDNGGISAILRIDNVRTCFSCPLTAVPINPLSKLEALVTMDDIAE